MTDNPRLIVNDENLIKMVTLQAKTICDLELENQRLEDKIDGLELNVEVLEYELLLSKRTIQKLKEKG